MIGLKIRNLAGRDGNHCPMKANDLLYMKLPRRMIAWGRIAAMDAVSPSRYGSPTDDRSPILP